MIARAAPAEKDDVATYVAFVMARLAPNMAESFNERQIHVTNQILTSDRTSMKDDLLEVLAILRMNSKWIHKRKHIFRNVMIHLDMGALDDLTLME